MKPWIITPAVLAAAGFTAAAVILAGREGRHLPPLAERPREDKPPRPAPASIPPRTGPVNPGEDPCGRGPLPRLEVPR